MIIAQVNLFYAVTSVLEIYPNFTMLASDYLPFLLYYRRELFCLVTREERKSLEETGANSAIFTGLLVVYFHTS